MIKKKLEKDLEAQGREYAERRGWLVCKFTSPSKRAFPDRFHLRRGRVIFIEYKKPDSNEKPTVQQELRHKEIRDHGGEVYWVNSMEQVEAILR